MKYRYRSDEEMKNSGVEWIGKIPKDWEVKKLKRISNIITGNTPSKNNEDNYKNGYMQWIKPDNIMENFTITDSKEKLSGEGVKQARIIPKNSAIVCCIGTVGKLGINTEECATNQQINSVIFNNKKIFNKFGIYSLIASRQEHEKNSNKVVVSILNKSQQGNIEIALSNYEKQEKIAKFLDEKTSYFNNIISKKEKLIEKLEEAKKSLISEVVTGKVKVVKNGDDFEIVKREDSEMKDSGVEWIGKIPKDWTIEKFSYLIKIKNGQVDPRTSPYKEMTLIAPNHIESNSGKIISLETALEQRADSGKYICDKDDIIYSKIRPNLCKVCVSPCMCLCSADMYPMKSNSKKLLQNYILWILLSDNFTKYAILESERVAMPKINRESLSKFKIALPSLEEQIILNNFLIEYDKKINHVIEKMNLQIAKLKEAKQALISEAVTGKIEILD